MVALFLMHLPSPIQTHNVGLLNDMPLHSSFKVGLCRVGIQLKDNIQGIDFKKISVRSSRRTGSSVIVLSEIIQSLLSSWRDGILFNSFPLIKKFLCPVLVARVIGK
jgi:hypothetical protein